MVNLRAASAGFLPLLEGSKVADDGAEVVAAPGGL